MDTANSRLNAIQAKIKSVGDEYEATLALVIGIAEAYKTRTGRDLDPNAEIDPQDEITARRSSLRTIPKAGA